MHRDRTIYLLLLLAVLGVYWPVYAFNFVRIDDPRYVYENNHVRDGLTRSNVKSALLGVTEGNWHPLTMFSHMIDCQIFGPDRPGMHHLVNLALHIANTLLVYRLFRLMTEKIWLSAIVAALFGLHPQHVESVAWISERKDLLSTFFFLLMLLAYRAYAERPNVLGYLGVFVLLLLGLLSKPMLVTAPFVALLLDFWPLGRWRPSWMQASPAEETRSTLKIFKGDDDEPGDDSGNETDDEEASDETDAGDDDALESVEDESDDDEPLSEPPDHSPTLLSQTPHLPERSLAVLIVEKLPLFVLAILFSIITYNVQQKSGAMDMLGDPLPWHMRLGNGIIAYGNYLSKTIYPTPLAVFYPYVRPRLVDAIIVGAALVALLVASFRMCRQRPYLIVGLLWFLGTLLPVIGIVQVGTQSMADRYTYIPLIGVFVIIAWGGAEFGDAWPKANRAIAAIAGLGILALISFFQLDAWRNSEALFRHATETPLNYRAHDALGLTLWDEDRVAEASEQFEKAATIVKAEPIFRKLGLVLAVLGKYTESREAFVEAIKLQPDRPESYRHLAWILATMPDPKFRDGKKAIALASKALTLDKTGDPLYRDTLAAAYAEAGEFDNAVAEARSAAARARTRGEADLAAEIDVRGKLYEEKKPYHHSMDKPRRF